MLAVFALREWDKSDSGGRRYTPDEMRAISAEMEMKDHQRKMERTAQDRLDIERTDFIVSGYGQKRNVRD